MKVVLPTINDIAEPLLKEFYKRKNKNTHISDLYDPLAEHFGLDEYARNEKATTTSEPHWNNNVRWSKEVLKNKELVESDKRGEWRITKKGCEHVERKINKKY